MVHPTAPPDLGHTQVKDSEVHLSHLRQVLGTTLPWREEGPAAEKRKICLESAQVSEPTRKEDPEVLRSSLLW